MVPPEEIEIAQPSTLPADFSEWDSGESNAAQPAKPEAVRVAVSPVMDRLPNAVPRASSKAYTETEQMFRPPQPKSEMYKDESKGKKKGLLPLIGVGGFTLLLIVGSLVYSRMPHGTSAPKPAAATSQTATITQPQVTNVTAPEPKPTPANTGTDQQRTQSDMMSHQLNAPSRIPTDLKMLAGREPPPSSGFASSGMEGMGGNSVAGNVFSGSNGPKVKIAAPSRMSISAGVAGGLLIQKTTPVYPPMAREARVSGTVVIQATISKTGSLNNLRVVSGPTMLRQPALDAVKTWRYKPYMLDGEPVEVETTVSVNFSLGG
jgi:protein TonB